MANSIIGSRSINRSPQANVCQNFRWWNCWPWFGPIKLKHFNSMYDADVEESDLFLTQVIQIYGETDHRL